jgi:hypothetical protein
MLAAAIAGSTTMQKRFIVDVPMSLPVQKVDRIRTRDFFDKGRLG